MKTGRRTDGHDRLLYLFANAVGKIHTLKLDEIIHVDNTCQDFPTVGIL